MDKRFSIEDQIEVLGPMIRGRVSLRTTPNSMPVWRPPSATRDRPASIKHRYDPENDFRLNTNIAPVA